MPKYSREPVEPGKSVKARASNLRVHYKNTHETAMALQGMELKKAQRYLEDVIAHKDAIPFFKHTGCIGRHAQGKKHKASQCRWPEKSCRFLLDLLQNAESNAEILNLDSDTLQIYHMQVNRAPKLRRRTYRAHGRINPYMSSPCHVEVILSIKPEPTKAAEADGTAKVRKPRAASTKLQNGATAAE